MRLSKLAGQKKPVYFLCCDRKKSNLSPDKRYQYDAAFKAAALLLADERRSTQEAVRPRGSTRKGIGPKLRYRWQQAQPVAEVVCLKVARDQRSAPRRIVLVPL